MCINVGVIVIRLVWKCTYWSCDLWTQKLPYKRRTGFLGYPKIIHFLVILWINRQTDRQTDRQTNRWKWTSYSQTLTLGVSNYIFLLQTSISISKPAVTGCEMDNPFQTHFRAFAAFFSSSVISECFFGVDDVAFLGVPSGSSFLECFAQKPWTTTSLSNKDASNKTRQTVVQCTTVQHVLPALQSEESCDVLTANNNNKSTFQISDWLKK